MTFSTDLERLAILSVKNQTTVEIWDVGSEEKLNSFSAPEGYEDFSVSPDLISVAALRFNDRGRDFDYTITLWNLTTQAVVHEYVIDDQSFGSDTFLFSPDSSLLAISSGQANNAIDVWDIGAGEFLPSSGKVAGNPLAFSEDNKKLVTKPACNSCVHIWGRADGCKARGS